MNIDVPSAAIEPFEPLGFPKLGIINYAGIKEALDEAFKTMNISGEKRDKQHRLCIDAIHLFLYSCIEQGGADGDSITIEDLFRADNNTCCYIVARYTTPNGKMQRYSGVVRSKFGFTESHRLLGNNE